MPQKQLEEFPTEIKEQLADGSMQIFAAAYNSAREDGLSEEGATSVAWNSVKQQYEQGADGKWHPKPEDTNQHHKSVVSGGN